MVQLTDKIYAVQVPDDAQDFQFEIEPSEDWYRLNWLTEIDDVESGFYGDWVQYHIDLPPGSYQYLFTTKEATWEQAESVVEKINGWYKNYEGDVLYSNPVDSLQSLLKAKSCDVNKNYAIIKKK